VALWTGTSTMSQLAPLIVASGIDYLTICGRANAGGIKGGLGGIPPKGSFSLRPKMYVG